MFHLLEVVEEAEAIEMVLQAQQLDLLVAAEVVVLGFIVD
jgi:hypothetical protein